MNLWSNAVLLAFDNLKKNNLTARTGGKVYL